MGIKIYDMARSAKEAIEVFKPYSDEPPNLIPTGLPIDKRIGGLFPGQGAILGAATGVGKSSIILASAVDYPTKVGVISLEDTADVWGSRLLSYASGVNSLKLRRKDLTDEDRVRLSEGERLLKRKKNLHIAYCIGAPLEEIISAIRDLAALGCKLIWIDYIQKIRGITDDRRNEVSTAFTKIQRACDKKEVAAIFVSQFSRQHDPYARPQLSWLKESGDLENETRLAILCQRDRDEHDEDRLICRVAKSTFGGENAYWVYRRGANGILKLDRVGEG